MKKRFTESQIVGFLREADAGVAVKDLCRKHGNSPRGKPHPKFKCQIHPCLMTGLWSFRAGAALPRTSGQSPTITE